MLSGMEKAGRGFLRIALLFGFALVAYFAANEVQKFLAPGAGFLGHMAIYVALLTLGFGATVLVFALRSRPRGGEERRRA